jgi:hypothetical protein
VCPIRVIDGQNENLALSPPLMVLAHLDIQSPCYNSVRETAKDECCVVFRLLWVLLATDHWPLATAPWTSINCKRFSK